VGAFPQAMSELRARRLDTLVQRRAAEGVPVLGICLGLQLLFEGSDEDGATTLGVLAGRTARLEGAPTLPHIGWNQVDRTRDHPIFAGIRPGADFYFVHSYAGVPAGPDGDAVTLATTSHGRPFVSAVARDHVIGVQFHPERSGADGLRLLNNAVGMLRGGAWPAASVPVTAGAG
jgi:glutamine amidotransferase